MRLLRIVYLAAVLALVSSTGSARTVPFRVTPDTLCTTLRDCWQSIETAWKFRAGDDPKWARPGFDDESWDVLYSNRRGVWLKKGTMKSVGWFRLHLQADRALAGRPLALTIKHIGALEVYLDGVLIETRGDFEAARRGEVTPLSMRLEDDPVQVVLSSERPSVLAIRMAAKPYSFAGARGLSGRVSLGFADYAQAQRAWRAANRFAMGLNYAFIGAALAFAVLHLLIFAFYRERSENLYYALGVVAVACIAITTVWFGGASSGRVYREAVTFFGIAVTASSVFLVRFYYAVFEPHLPRTFWGILAVGLLLVFGAWWLPRVVFYGFAGLCLIEQTRMLLVALHRRTRGAWIMAIGGAGWIAGAGWQMAGDMDLVAAIPFIYLYGFLALFASISVYLALSIGRDKRELARQITQIHELSQARLEQQRRASEEALARKELEAENARHALQLEEARKREVVLQALEQANRNLREAQAQLVQSEKMAALGKLVAGVAHEINTPVGAMHSVQGTLGAAAQILAEHIESSGEPPRRVRRALSAVEDASTLLRSGTERVTSIVRRLKSFARLDEAERKIVDIHQGLDDTLALMHHELKRGVEVERAYGKIPPIPCYPGRLNQVFLNVLVNAAQAIEDKGKITIRTSRADGHVSIEVTDDGVGIAPDVLSKIFDPGFTTKGVGVGTGLGLSIAYQIVADHQGRIAADSVLGCGTTMRITLPVEA